MKRPTKSWQRKFDPTTAARLATKLPKVQPDMTTEEYVRKFEQLNHLVATTRQENK